MSDPDLPPRPTMEEAFREASRIIGPELYRVAVARAAREPVLSPDRGGRSPRRR